MTENTNKYMFACLSFIILAYLVHKTTVFLLWHLSLQYTVLPYFLN